MKKIISTDTAPKTIGAYSQAVCVNGFLYTSGQLPIDPATNELKGTTMSEQTAQCMENGKLILEANGMTMDDVVKTTVFITDISRFAEMNSVYATYFSNANYPARSATEVSALAKCALVEIEFIAYK